MFKLDFEEQISKGPIYTRSCMRFKWSDGYPFWKNCSIYICMQVRGILSEWNAYTSLAFSYVPAINPL